jgi:DNA repair exonuclease SbcCD ATPase subunit
MAKKKQEKRKFIEDIFNLSIFGDMLDLLRTDITEIKKTFDIEGTRHDEVQKNILSLEKQKDNLALERERKKEKYSSRHKNNLQEIDDINKKLVNFKLLDIVSLSSEIKEQENNLEKVNKKLQDLRHFISEKKTLITQSSKKLGIVGTDKEICPTCLRNIQDVDRDHIKNEIKKIKKEISDDENNILTLTKEVNQYETLQQRVNFKIQKIRDDVNSTKHKQIEKETLESRLSQLNKWQLELEQDLKDLVKDDNAYDLLIQEQQDNLIQIKQKIEQIKDRLHTLDIVKFVISEEGVKSYIVKKILQLFNSKLSYYLKKMDANCICTFNEYFEEQIIDNKGKECSYFNFSGAERKNIDLACLFTFMDIRRLQGDVSFNFSIYDELFDSSLDEKGVDLVIGILKERVEKYKECIMVISHRKESIKAATGEIIFLEKTNGITKRVDYKEYN